MTHRPILQLPDHVVNKIAAGEVIQRPANALKELMENSIDAGATNIKITVKDGGIKLLQIQDNGSGIKKSDLELLCTRFATSKITSYTDLHSLTSFGFRGEALASISYVAHLSVVTKTRDDENGCAWKAYYTNGEMVPLKPGGPKLPTPCAGSVGTTFTVQSLFYATPTRLKTLRPPAEEYALIYNTVLAYAIEYPSIVFSLRKEGKGVDFSSPGGDISNQVELRKTVIGKAYGDQVKLELLHVKYPLNDQDSNLGIQVEGVVTGLNYQGKKSTFLIFVNHRHVTSVFLKRAIEAFYAPLLPKGSHPFVFVSLSVPPEKLDVNMHPTKKEVGFEDEANVGQAVCEAIASAVEKDGNKRKFSVQALNPSTSAVNDNYRASKLRSDHPVVSEDEDAMEQDEIPLMTPSKGLSTPIRSFSSTKKLAPNKMVRVDDKIRRLDSVFGFTSSRTNSIQRQNEDREESGFRISKRQKPDENEDTQIMSDIPTPIKEVRRTVKLPISQCFLKSIQSLRTEVNKECNLALQEVLQRHVVVGVVDSKTCMTVVQHQTDLYLVNHQLLSEQLFYQLGLRQFGKMSKIKLNPSPKIQDLIRIGIQSAVRQGQVPPEFETKVEDMVTKITDELVSRRMMLDDYFSLVISRTGRLESLPRLLSDYTPDLTKLPLFLVRLALQVNWESEKQCFHTLLQQIGVFYSFDPFHASSSDCTEEQKHTIEHTIFPAAKMYLSPSTNGKYTNTWVKVTSLERLYRVFERC